MRISGFILILLLGILVVLESCNQPVTSHTNSQTTTTIQTTPTTEPPQLLEKDILDLIDKQSFAFRLSVGQRVEGEVTVVTTYVDGTVVSTIKDSVLSTILDPYGNIIFQSATKNVIEYTHLDIGGEFRNVIHSNQKYPWGFAFSPATNGEYALEVSKILGERQGTIEDLKEAFQGQTPGKEIISVHLKVTIYPK